MSSPSRQIQDQYKYKFPEVSGLGNLTLEKWISAAVAPLSTLATVKHTRRKRNILNFSVCNFFVWFAVLSKEVHATAHSSCTTGSAGHGWHTEENRQNCTTPPFNRNFGIFLGWHVIIWDGSQAFCTEMKILHLILLRFVKLESEISLLIQNYVTSNYFS